MLALHLAGCIQYTIVEPGEAKFTNMTLSSPIAWNKSPFKPSPIAGSQSWTNNGEGLDRVMFIPGVESGKPMFRSFKENSMPVYDSGMLPVELSEFVEASLTKWYGEGQVDIEVSNLAPASIDNSKGIRFDISYMAPIGYPVKGKAVVLQKDEKLYIVIFTAAEQHYFDLYEKTVDQMFESIKISIYNELFNLV